MPEFQLVSDFQATGDQPQAIEKLVEGLRQGHQHQTLLGATGTGKTYTIAKVVETVQRPTLVMAHNKTLAAQLYSEFCEFFPHNAVEYFVSYYDYYQPEAYLPRTDTYIEKDADINDEINKLRLAATEALLTRRDVIIVASVSAIYGIGAPEEYGRSVVELQVGMNRRRDGKSYKDWLFARGTDPAAPGGPTLPALESGVSLLLRDVVRERLRRERAPARVRSLQEPVAGTGGAEAVTLEDLLPGGFDTAGEVERRDVERLADRLAEAVSAALSRRERVALLTRERGLSCAHPAVLKAAGCGKTALAEAAHSALRAVAGQVQRAIPREPASARAALSVAVFEAVRRRIRTWDQAENPLAGFLYE